jgi:nitrite reductase (NADH) small subunit
MSASTQSGVRHVVCGAAELKPGSRMIIEIDGRSIGIFNIQGSFFALKNVCPHKYAPLCEGKVTALTTGERPGKLIVERDGEILRCPWHGWEFDILTGKSIVNPNRIRTKSYKACLEDPLNSGSLGCGVEKLESLETYVTKIEGRELVVYL